MLSASTHTGAMSGPYTQNFVGTRTATGVSLPANPAYTHSWRDASSTHMSLAGYHDIFANTEEPRPNPWVAEHRLQFQAPDKYSARVQNMTVVATNGNTDMAHVTHHTHGITSLGGTMYRGLQHDAAFEEEVYVSRELLDRMPEVISECNKYHLHCPDGWITSAGFVVAAKKANVPLTRAQFLAIERAVPKDTLGRINYNAVMDAVTRLASGTPPSPPATGHMSTMERTSRVIA